MHMERPSHAWLQTFFCLVWILSVIVCLLFKNLSPFLPLCLSFPCPAFSSAQLKKTPLLIAVRMEWYNVYLYVSIWSIRNKEFLFIFWRATLNPVLCHHHSMENCHHRSLVLQLLHPRNMKCHHSACHHHSYTWKLASSCHQPSKQLCGHHHVPWGDGGEHLDFHAR